MLLAYTYCFGPQSSRPELCIIPAKPDQFSTVVRIDSLIDTDCAILRLSATEGLKVRHSRTDNTFFVEPVVPSKLYITPSQPDRPGITVKSLKIRVVEDKLYEVSFADEGKDVSWKRWKPNEQG